MCLVASIWFIIKSLLKYVLIEAQSAFVCAILGKSVSTAFTGTDIVLSLDCYTLSSLCCAMDTWPIVVDNSLDNNC